jgi:hypothetical protein
MGLLLWVVHIFVYLVFLVLLFIIWCGAASCKVICGRGGCLCL